MEAKKTVHITWEEAHRAETERDKARQRCCRSIPPNQMKLTTVYVSRDLRKLKASALRLWDVRFNHGVGASGYKGETLFSPTALTKSAVGIFLGIILLAGVGTVSYSQQSKNYLSHLAVKWGAIAQRAVRYTSDLEGMVQSSKAQPVAPQLSSTNQEPVQPDGRESTSKKARDYLGNFEVVDDSFVRDNPQANATVIATLRPGTQIRVESKTGEYLRIRSLHDPEVIGYVHKEDAFFQAH